jgi:hypothetical protein
MGEEGKTRQELESESVDWFNLATDNPYCVGKALEHLDLARRYREEKNLGLQAFHCERAGHYLLVEANRLRGIRTRIH